MLITLDTALITAAWRRARSLAPGNVRAGLGFSPIRRRRLLAALIVGSMTIPYFWAYFLRSLLTTVHVPELLQLMIDPSAGPFLYAVMIFLIGILAPIAEELFFRGWLWTGLSRHWPPLPVMLATAVPWVLLHATSGLVRPLFLVPAAVLVSLARHYCGSVRASILLHMANNLFAALLITLASMLVRP